jgi:predicted MFS family arabinose efflux permease
MNKILKIYLNSFKGLSIESWMLSIVMLINRTGSMVLPFLGVYMIDYLKFSIEQSGLVLACFGVGSVIGSWLGGTLTDKLGEYYVQVLSLFISVPLFCIYPLFETPIQLGAIVLIQSVVSELFRPANSVAIAKYAKKENLTRAFSLNRMAVNLGFSFGPALGGILATISYNFLFFINGLMTLVAAFVYMYFFRKRHILYKLKQKRKNNSRTEAVSEITTKELSPYKDVPFIIFCLFCALFSICFFQLMSTLPMFYKDGLGLDQFTIGILMGANGFTVVLFEMLLVHVAEKKWTIPLTLLLGTILCAISYLLLAFEPGYALLFISIMLLSIGEILVLPFMATVTSNRSGTSNKGAYMGMNGIAFSLAFIVAPILGTKLSHNIGYGNLWIGTAILLTLCAMAFFATTPMLKKAKKSI